MSRFHIKSIIQAIKKDTLKGKINNIGLISKTKKKNFRLGKKSNQIIPILNKFQNFC